MAALLLYHADAELSRVSNVLTVAALLLLTLLAFLLVARAPGEDRGRRLEAKVALVLAIAGIAAHVALQFMQGDSWDTGRRNQVAWTVFLMRMASFLTAAPIALAAFLRGQGRLSAIALALSLVLPVLLVVWVVTCGVTDACFH